VSAGEIHKGDIGTVFKATVLDSAGAVVNISAATLLQFTFYRADKTKLIVTPVFTTNGTDGLIQYTSVSGDINSAGQWKLQGYVETDANHHYYSDIQSFKVYENLDY
jgi:hypothetical protein